MRCRSASTASQATSMPAMSRRSGSREPWYPRGTEMRNERQLSIVARCTGGCRDGSLPDSAWVLARRDQAGVDRRQSRARRHAATVDAASGTLLFFEGGVTSRSTRRTVRAAIAGRSIAEHAGMADVEAARCCFPRCAKRLRGLVAWVEKPGRSRRARQVSVRVPEQWMYRAHSDVLPALPSPQGACDADFYSSSSGSSRRVARQRVSTALIWSMTKKRAESRS